jgi:hypothetical protein
MPQVGFEPKIPAFERAKTGHVLDCVTTVIGKYCYLRMKYISEYDTSVFLEILQSL